MELIINIARRMIDGFLPSSRRTQSLCLGALLLAASPAFAATNVVVTTTNDSGAGSLRDAVIAVTNSPDGGSITFSNVTGVIKLLSALPGIDKPVLILGPGATNLAVSGQAKYRAFRILPAGACYLSGLTIRDGNTMCDNSFWHIACDGGGIFNEGQLTVVDCVFTNNRLQNLLVVESGGALASSGSLILSNDLFVGNYAAYGAGAIKAAGDFRMTDCVVKGNSAHDNAGGVATGGNVTIARCLIQNNGSSLGGGIVVGGIASMTDTTVNRNSSNPFPGGGVYNSGTLYMTNCTLTGNIGTRYDIYNHDGSAILNSSNVIAVNCTIVSNRFNGWTNGATISGTISIQNTIIAGNTWATSQIATQTYATVPITGTLTSLGHNLIDNTNNAVIAGDQTGNLYGVDPLIGPLQDNGGPVSTHTLLAGSPAIDAGTIFGTPATDARGISRPQGLGVDIGAVEVQCLTCAPLVITQCNPTADGCAQLTATGIPGDVCLVQASTNMLEWQTLGAATNIAGLFHYSDTTAAQAEHRYYRLQRVLQ